MAASCAAVQVKLELGHRAQVRKKPTIEGFTHDWMVFVRGPEHSNIQHFVEKVVFHLHDSFPRPKRVCKDPPYKVEESGYAGFIMPIEVYFRNKEEPKKVRFDYDLFLHLEGHPPVNHLRCEKLTFNNPTEEFRRKLLKAGGDPNKSSAANSSNTSSKPHKSTKEHKDKPSKDSKEHKSAFKEPSREHSKTSKELSKKPKENKPLKDEKTVPKTAFKEPKPMSKEPKSLENNPVSGTGGIQQDLKALTKRLPNTDSDELSVKKRKKSSSELLLKSFSNASPPEKKHVKDKSHVKTAKMKMENEVIEKKKPSLPPFEEIVDANDSALDETSSKSEEGNECCFVAGSLHANSGPRTIHLLISNHRSQQPSPTGSSSSSNSSSSFTPSQNNRQGPLRSIMEDLHSEDNESDEDENGSLSDVERSLNTHCGSRGLRMSLSDGSDSENSSTSSPPRSEAPPILKASNSNNQAYLDELVELHRRLMTLRERHILQQIVNLIEETGHFHITNTTFDFDLCSLDKTTVRKLQSYLETSGTS
ncbi:protein AF-9 isoform X2 [Stegostoma tigrinum]|uniref:protein AF-9 isoform X2 n=1 Tax=Stegostoma tigrinum TaxID=3053191 RepID=UPI00202B7C2D|nr:protein AF-9 isoform X2 [Stegostoma tigrinum]